MNRIANHNIPDIAVNTVVHEKCCTACSDKEDDLLFCFQDQLDIAWPSINTLNIAQRIPVDQVDIIGPR